MNRKIQLIEPEHFAKTRTKLMNHHQFDVFKDYLITHPENGVLVKGTGGCRKMRWRYQHCGKTGGIRVVYYYARQTIHLMFIYVKNRQKELTMKERQECRNFVKSLC